MLYIVQKISAVVSAVVTQNEIAHGINHKDGAVCVGVAGVAGKRIIGFRRLEGHKTGMFPRVRNRAITGDKRTPDPVGITVESPVRTSGNIEPFLTRLFAAIRRYQNPPFRILILGQELKRKGLSIAALSQIHLQKTVTALDELPIIGGCGRDAPARVIHGGRHNKRRYRNGEQQRGLDPGPTGFIGSEITWGQLFFLVSAKTGCYRERDKQNGQREPLCCITIMGCSTHALRFPSRAEGARLVIIRHTHQ